MIFEGSQINPQLVLFSHQVRGNFQPNFLVVLHRTGMQRHGKTRHRLFDCHRLGGRMDCLQERKVFVNRFRQLVDMVNGDVVIYSQEIRLSNGFNIQS